MRVVTSLFIAAVISSTSIGTLTRYLQKTQDSTPQQAMKQLLEKDRPAALRLLKQTSLICIPGLNKLKSSKARDFFPKMLVTTIDMVGTGGEGPTQPDRMAMASEIQQLLRVIPEEDAMVLAAVGKQLKDQQEKIKNCVLDTLGKFGREELRKRSKPLLSDAELRTS